jgi:hypothetical protein
MGFKIAGLLPARADVRSRFLGFRGSISVSCSRSGALQTHDTGNVRELVRRSSRHLAAVGLAGDAK